MPITGPQASVAFECFAMCEPWIMEVAQVETRLTALFSALAALTHGVQFDYGWFRRQEHELKKQLVDITNILNGVKAQNESAREDLQYAYTVFHKMQDTSNELVLVKGFGFASILLRYILQVHVALLTLPLHYSLAGWSVSDLQEEVAIIARHIYLWQRRFYALQNVSYHILNAFETNFAAVERTLRVIADFVDDDQYNNQPKAISQESISSEA